VVPGEDVRARFIEALGIPVELYGSDFETKQTVEVEPAENAQCW
jgi:hypothetical protein